MSLSVHPLSSAAPPPHAPAAAPLGCDTGLPKTFAQSLTLAERKLRWFIVGWITLSTILNLVDKNTLSILAPTLSAKFQLSQTDYSHIIMAFQLAYAVMYVVAGRFVDLVGEKIGMTACVVWWSLAAMLHALARGALSFGLARFLLGIGEPGNYPAALRATARWFAKEERGLPIAIWSSGSSVGSLISVPIIAFLALHLGWRSAFVVPGLVGIVWVLVWTLAYRLPSAAAEGPAFPVETSTTDLRGLARPITFLDLIKDGRVLALVGMRLLNDPIWVFYISWMPKYLAEVWKFDLKQLALFGWIPFLFGGMGGMFGGVASDWLIRRGLPPATARKACLYVTGALAPLGMLTGYVGSAGVSIALLAMMAFICYTWFISTAALMSDIFPERVVGSVLGLAAGVGQFGGILMAALAGYLLERGGADLRHSYASLFVVAGSGHLLAVLLLFLVLRERPNRTNTCHA
jgi:ACS family hexuronate transporter-like MFS transporter